MTVPDPLADVLDQTDHAWEHGDGEEDLWVVMARAARKHIANEVKEMPAHYIMYVALDGGQIKPEDMLIRDAAVEAIRGGTDG